MSVPTITSVTPSSGPTRGRRLVKIVGTNFALPPAPVPTGPTPGTIKPAVQVLFGAEPALEVHVLSTTLLHVVSPVKDAGLVSVTVRNVDQAGVLVGAETVTAANAYTFARPDFNQTGVNESILARVVRAFMRELKRQVLENVVIAVHTDYDNTLDGANIAMVATAPAIVLSGPTLRTNRFYSTNEVRQETVSSQTYEKRPARTVDIVFTIIGVHDLLQPSMNFMQEVVGFFEGNKNLRVLENPSVPNTYIDFETKIENDFAMSKQSDANPNIHIFSGTIAIVGVDLDDSDMAMRAIFDAEDIDPSLSAMV